MEEKGFCVTCRTVRWMTNVTSARMRDGVPVRIGVCPKCGTKMYVQAEEKGGDGKSRFIVDP